MSLFDLVPERYHLAADDYEELWDTILDHPSPEKSLEGDPYQPYRSIYRRQKHAAFPGVGTGLSSPSTGDSGQRHTDLEAPPGPMPSIDFVPYEEGTRCSYCNERPAEITVNGAALCLKDAEERWGIPVGQVPETGDNLDYLSSDQPAPPDTPPEEPAPAMDRSHTARWVDVREKAKRLRANKAVHLLEVPSPDSPYVFAEVQGDNALHHCFVAVKGDEQGQWSCSCPWGDFGPNGPLAEDRSATSPYKKTPCSHVLATRWELQSRSMFGRNPYTGALKEDPMVDILDQWFAGRFLHEAQAPAQHAPGMGPEHLISPHEQPEGSFLKGPKGEPDTRYPLPDNPRATHLEDFPQEHQDLIHDHVAQWGPAHRGKLNIGRVTQNFVNEYREARTGHNLEASGDGQYHLRHKETGEVHSSYGSLGEAEEGLKNLSQEKGRKNSDRLEHTLNWYPDAHHEIHGWSQDTGVKAHHMAGAVAALSPNTDWASNMETAHYMAKHLGAGTNENFTYTPSGDPKLKDWDDRMSKLHGRSFHSLEDHEAAEAVAHQARFTDKLRVTRGEPSKSNSPDTKKGEMPRARWSYNNGNTPNITRAVRIIRGEEPNDVLSGHKVRSFYNNLVSPHEDPHESTTMDTHHISAGTHAKYSGSSPKGSGQSPLQKVFENPSPVDIKRKYNAKGTYSFFASATRRAHRQLVDSGELEGHHKVSALQAGIWENWKEKTNRKKVGAGEDVPYLQTMDHLRDTNEKAGHHMGSLYVTAGVDDTIDPYNYDDEEPDPDIYPEEHTRWAEDRGEHTFAPEGDKPDDWNALDEEEQMHREPDDEGYDELPTHDDYTDMLTDRRKEGAMYDWTNMLRSARRERLAAIQATPVATPRPEPPVQYLAQVPHHLSLGYDEFGFDPHQANDQPSEQWQEEHSPGAKNPASTAPKGFGDNLDPNWTPGKDIGNSTYPDERLLEPGPVLTSPIRSPGFSSGYEVMFGHKVQAQGGGGGSSYVASDPVNVYAPQAPMNPQPPFPMVQTPNVLPQSGPIIPDSPPGAAGILAEHQAGLEWLRPPGGAPDAFPGASPGMSREAATQDNMNLAAGAEAFLKTGSIPVPGFEVNMDTILAMPVGSLSGMSHDARSRDFTPAEQEEMVREGEHEGAKASNLHMLRLEGSMYEELERQLQGDNQSQDSATAFWW